MPSVFGPQWHEIVQLAFCHMNFSGISWSPCMVLFTALDAQAVDAGMCDKNVVSPYIVIPFQLILCVAG